MSCYTREHAKQLMQCATDLSQMLENYLLSAGDYLEHFEIDFYRAICYQSDRLNVEKFGPLALSPITLKLHLYATLKFVLCLNENEDRLALLKQYEESLVMRIVNGESPTAYDLEESLLRPCAHEVSDQIEAYALSIYSYPALHVAYAAPLCVVP